MNLTVCQFRYSYLLGFALFVVLSENRVFGVVDQSISCEFCCPHLFDTTNGIISIRDGSSLFHSISYIVRCLMSTDETVIVSDASSNNPFWIDWGGRYHHDEIRKRVCTHAENVLLSHVRATEFLEANPGYLRRLVPTIDPARPTTFEAMMAKRTNFIFIPDTQEQMIALISKLEKELTQLRTGRRFFWQPYIVFIWPETQYILRKGDRESLKEDEPGDSILHSWFQSFQPYFTVDSGIFFFFIVQKGNSTRSRMNLFLSVWESYKLKGRFFVKKVSPERANVVFQRIKEEKCNSTVRRVNPLLSWMEKINSYVFLKRFSRRDNFGLLPITASIVPSETSEWIVFQRNANGTVSLQRGSPVDLYQGFQIMMNFSDDIQIGDHVQYRNESGVLQLNSEKADILLNPRSVTPGRGQLYSFLQPTYFGIYEAFFKQPSDDLIRNIVSAPFAIDLWTIIIILWLTIIGCLHGWGYVAKRNCLCTKEDDEFLQGIGVWAIAVISQKSWYTSPSSLNFKSIYYISSLTALVCYSAYSAMIVSFLTVKIIPIQTMNDLATYNYKYTVHESSEATVSLLQEMITINNLPQSVIKINTENEITHLIQRPYALLSYPDLFYETAKQQNYTENFICSNIYSLPAGNTPYQSAMSVRKGSQYREIFSEKLLFIMERGLNYRYRKKYDNNRSINCVNKNYDDAKRIIDPVRLTDVFTTFLLIFTGWVVSFSMFGIEKVIRRRRAVYNLMFIFK